MQWQVTTPPANPLFTTDQLAYHLIIDSDIAYSQNEVSYLSDLLASAVEYAETATQSSLLTRTITATYYTGDELDLPRGPVIAVSSVTDSNNNPIVGYSVQRTGNTDTLVITPGWVGPITVVYTAGYGITSATVPADIKQAIRAHIGSMYENRQSVSDRPANVVPHSLEMFYQRKNRQTGVG